MDQHKGVVDIDSKSFDADRFVNILVKETSLRHLIDKEKELVREIQSLDSEMQTLVYENYNKFILATDTIRQMKSDFKAMEDEMGKLVAEMSEIASFSNNISANLQDRHQKISQLSNTNETLKSLQFLFDLPKTLKQCLDNSNFEMAVNCYTRSEKVLKEFGDHPSFKGIQADCDFTLNALKEELWKQFKSSELASSEVEKIAKLLRKLGESLTSLEDEYLEISRCRLEKDLRDFESSVVPDDTLEHTTYVEQVVEKSCNSCLNNIAITVATFNNVFPDSTKRNHMCELGAKMMNEVCLAVETKLIEATGPVIDEPFCLAVAAAVDKYNRRFIAVQRLLDVDNQTSCSVPGSVIDKISQRTADILHEDWIRLLNDQLLSWTETNSETLQALDSVKRIEAPLIESTQRALIALTAFLGQHLTFSQDARYRRTLGIIVRERIVVNCVKKLVAFLSEIGNQPNKVVPTLMLILSRVAMDFHQSLVHSLLSLVDEQFEIASSVQEKLSAGISSLVHECKSVSQSLLQRYVKNESHLIVQMIRKSMDSREWLTASEPRSVRPVVKRVLEEISRVDSLAAQLFDDGMKREKGSDSSRRTHSARLPHKSSWSSFGPSQIDSSLLNNIQKLFSERVDLSGTIEPTKTSIILALIKICLKGFLECVRLKTFGRYGVQQIQVDCFYLQLFLWRFTPDENLIHGLLDEILSSALQRCLESVLMEPGVVELICER